MKIYGPKIQININLDKENRILNESTHPYNNSGRTSLDLVTVPLTDVNLPTLFVRMARIRSTRGRL